MQASSGHLYRSERAMKLDRRAEEQAVRKNRRLAVQQDGHIFCWDSNRANWRELRRVRFSHWYRYPWTAMILTADNDNGYKWGTGPGSFRSGVARWRQDNGLWDTPHLNRVD